MNGINDFIKDVKEALERELSFILFLLSKTTLRSQQFALWKGPYLNPTMLAP